METFNPFRFEGRIGRLQYFGFAVIWAVILYVMALVVALGGEDVGTTGALMWLVLTLVYVVATVSYGVRRLHDIDKSGWWYLLAFVPLANLMLALILLIGPGTPGPNRFGVRDGYEAAVARA